MGPADSSEKKKGPRILFIGNIRILLMCLVIATHSAVTYGAQGTGTITRWDLKDLQIYSTDCEDV